MRARTPLLVVATLGLVLVLAVPGDAAAQLNPCAPSAPAPRRPDTGMPGWFATTPADPPVSAGPETPPQDLFATYGTAGLWWPTWDLGCSGSAEGLVTDMANVPMDWMSATLNGTASVRQIAWAPDWLRPLDETVAALTDRLGNFFGVAMGLALTAVGVWMLFRARSAEYGEITTAGAWAVFMIALAAVALSYPAWAGGTWDDYVVGSAKLVNDTLAGEADAQPGTDPAVSQINGDVAYRVWLRGMFGSDTTTTAEVFGPRFYSAMAFAWSELPTLDRGGAEAEALTEAHRQAFIAAARDLEVADPSAYRTMQGKGAFSTRVPTGLVGWVLVGCLCFMAGVAAVLVLVARLVGRGLVMALPIVIPFGTLYRWSGPVRKLGGMAQAVVVALIVATIAGGLMTRAVGALLSTNWPLWLVGLVSLVATYAAWKALKPIGTVAGLVGLGGAARLPRHAMGALLAVAGIRAGAKAGVEAGEEAAAASAGRVSRAEDFAAGPPADPVALPPATTAPAGSVRSLPPATTVGSPASAATSIEPEALNPVPPRSLEAGPSAWPRSMSDAPESAPDPPEQVMDAHLVVGSDGREIYQVYQRAEAARQ